MKLYDNYIDNIKNVIAKEKSLKGNRDHFEKNQVETNALTDRFMSENTILSYKPLNSLEPLITTVGKYSIHDQKPGEHPDFKHLKSINGSEYHYITSTFIDIKNSTGLFKKYNPDVVRVITNTIQRAAIHTCVIFGGYIQRLQGDGLFVYFGGKNIPKNDSVVNSLNATSMFTYFVKNDLRKLFETEGIEDINTRIGIDFGDDHQVLWSVAGIGDCSEITTYSLHTSLASKMLKIANTNGIVVGDNVKSFSRINEDYFDWVRDSTGNIKQRYVFEDKDKNVYYKALEFDWLKYLKTLPFIYQNDTGELFFESEQENRERIRLNSLRNTAGLLSSSNGYTNQNGNISGNSDGIKNREHRFHYE